VTNPTKIGRYEIIERVGRGGMGAVYRGHDTVLDREVAVKVMSSDFAADETSRPRFYREARAAAKLQHRNIVTIFEFGEEDETPFIVMEFLRGQDLSKRVRAEPPLTLAQKIDIIAELCTGLHFAHEQGVIHRDVKPANIWLAPDGSVKLLDFGIAKFSSSTMTRQGSVFGSISYMSPEQVNGSDVDGRADIFSAGVVLYELLTGRKPFSGDSPTAVLARIMDDEPASMAELPPDLPRALVPAIARALEKDREKRYHHAGDFGADLRLVRSAMTAGIAPAALHVDLAETTFTDTSGRGLDSNRPHPAASVAMSRTALLDEPEAVPPPEPRRRSHAGWLAPLAALVVVGLATGGWLLARGRGASPAVPAAQQPPAAASHPVRIQSQPPGASIAVDGVQTGRITPADIEVASSRLPTVTLTLGGRRPVSAQLTMEDVKSGSLLLAIDGAGSGVPPAPGTGPAPAPVESKTRVVMHGDYPFEVLEGGRVVSAASASHQITVGSRARLRVRSQEYFLDQPLQLDGRALWQWEAPALGRLVLIVREACTVTVGGWSGEPPVNLTMAAGTHVAEVVCPGESPKRRQFTITAGAVTKETVR
jgi:hypothetical protein